MFFSFSSSAKGQTTQTTPLIETREEKTREFQTQLLHYFSESYNKNNHRQRAAREQPSPGPSPSINAPVACSMTWAAQLHAVMQQHAWAAAVQTPRGAARQFAAHQALLVAMRTQQAGAGGGVASAAAAGSSANEASSFGTAVDQGHKSLAEMRQERQVHPNMKSIFRHTYCSPPAWPSAANSAAKDVEKIRLE